MQLRNIEEPSGSTDGCSPPPSAVVPPDFTPVVMMLADEKAEVNKL